MRNASWLEINIQLQLQQCNGPVITAREQNARQLDMAQWNVAEIDTFNTSASTAQHSVEAASASLTCIRRHHSRTQFDNLP